MQDTHTKKIIESTFNEVSKRYDTNLFFKITASHMANCFDSKDDLTLLDISTGTGTVAFEIINKHPNIQIQAVDISKGMLDVAKEKAHNFNIKNISFKLFDVEKLHNEKNSFDIITCGFGLFFYPNMHKTFNQLCKTIKKEGLFIFSSFTQDAFKPYSDIFLNALEKDYNISHPKRKSGLLNSQEEIKSFVTKEQNLKYNIQEVDITYDITIDQWWELLNSAGYKALLNELDEKQLQTFKVKHLKEMKDISKKDKITLKVNTFITTVFL